jgi:glycosyltransferase involved in cell wall biosynthesis
MARRRLALLLPQLPQDPASGAARNLRSAVQLLAGGGYEVECLATTATELAVAVDPVTFLQNSGLAVQSETCNESSSRLLRFSHAGIAYHILDVGCCVPDRCQATHGRAFDALWLEMLRRFSPDIILTYGARDDDLNRHRLAREHGARIVFSLQNLAYLQHVHRLRDVDAVVTCSRFVTDSYARAAGLASTPLLTPILPEEVVASERQPLMVTFVNPAIEKGLMFFVRLAEELCRRRPDVPVLVVEGRGTREDVIGAAQLGGFDLRRHENLLIAPAVAHPKDIFAGARLLLVPSVWEEPAGRVAVEALVNGVPPIVSDRGGLPEVCAGGGMVLPLPGNLSLETAEPVHAGAVEPWLEQVLRLCDDASAYQAASEAAATAGRRYAWPALLDQYLRFFESVASAG